MCDHSDDCLSDDVVANCHKVEHMRVEIYSSVSDLLKMLVVGGSDLGLKNEAQMLSQIRNYYEKHWNKGVE